MGSVTITAIAMLENPRTAGAGKPKSFLFDAQIWLPTERALIAGMRYFNANGYEFDAKVNKCLIIANITRYSKDLYKLLHSSLSEDAYDVFGDIIQLIPLPDEVDPRMVPFVQVAGTADEAHDVDFTMELTPRLAYVSQGTELAFPVMGHFRDLTRYQNSATGKPPVPGAKSIATFSGLLTSTTGRDEGKVPDRFHVDVESVSFLGRSTAPIPRNYQREGPKTPGSTPKNMNFDFDSLPSPETPTKKRKTRATAGSSTQA